MSDNEAKLFDLMLERCYREGDFTLSSGKKSTYYFDGKQLMFSSKGASLIGEVLYERTKDMDLDAIGGLEIGAVPLTTAVCYKYDEYGKEMEGFVVRNKQKSHGTMNLVEGKVKPGDRVAIVDDVITQGGSAMKAVDAILAMGATPVIVIALVDRDEGGAELFRGKGIPYHPVFHINQFKEALVK